MIPTYVVPVDKIPLTTNGKIDRNALPEPEAAGAADHYTAPRNEIEEKLVAIWADVLDKDQDIIGIDANFFKLGGHSLKVTILAAKIHKELDRTIQLAEIFKIPTIRELAKYIKGCEEKEFASVKACEKKEHHVLSSAQKRLYIIQQLEINSTAYNMPQLYALGEKTEKQRLEKTLKQLISRHENLRTSFKMVAGEPVQIIHEPQQIEFRVTYLETGEKDVGTLFKNFVKPFNLGNAPLLRVSLAIIQEKKHLMMIDMHHIITDGVSHEILIQDFNLLYAGKELAPLTLQYKDYSEWQYCDRQKTRIKQQEAYWLKEFSGEIPVMDLPTDFVRPEIQGFQGGIVSFEINKELTGKIKVLVRETEITLNIFLLAVYNILLSKYSGAEDIIVGIPVAGRTHDDLQRIIGMFVNMLPMRNHPSRDKTFITLLKEIKQNSLRAYENQDYQYDDLVLKLGLQGNRSRNPLFDVVFALQNVAETITSIHNKNNAKNNDDHLNMTPFQLEIQKFDLILEAIEVHDFIHMSLGYSSNLFKRANVERMAKHYIDITNQVLESIHIKLAEITIEHEFLVPQLNSIKEGEGDFRF
jgi:acyl carrier protein